MPNRRQFFSTLAGAALTTSIQTTRAAQNKTLRFGVIGCGWYGGVVTNAAFANGGVEVAAICDLDTAHLDKFATDVESKQGAKPKRFDSYEDLLAMDGLDFVVIATPPQWHALPFIAACKKGRNIYCEKPVAYDIREAQAMAAAAEAAGNVVQIGFQRRQSDAFTRAAEYLRSGAPGKIVQVDANIHYTAKMRDTTVTTPPATLDWDTWCGPAPKLPYSENIGHFAWRLEKHYGNGHLVDWGIHLIDATRMMTGIDLPRQVQAMGGLYHLKGQITTPDTLTVQWDFDEFPLVWRPRLWGSKEYSPQVNNGVFFYCEKETVFVSDSRMEIVPAKKDAERKVMPANLKGRQMQEKHVGNFLAAVRGLTKPQCRIEDAMRSTATVQLGMIAYEAGAAIRFDAGRMDVVNNAKASKMIKRAYRSGYTHTYHG
jgi:predicted dehydrogenase